MYVIEFQQERVVSKL